HAGGSDPDLTVDFQYEDGRVDPIRGFQGGVGVLQARRLFRIVTGVSAENPAGYGVYTLNYEEDGDLISRLTSVDYCATDDAGGSAITQCLEPLAFEWS